MNRRKFIKVGSSAGILSAMPLPIFSSNKKALKILMLGGTNFVGPHFVNQALRRGHEVTLFNRGMTNPGMFANLELIKGNRYPDKGNGINGLKGNRKWDAVIDTWSSEPGCIGLTAELLKNRVDQYVYISSIATFKNFKEHNLTEEGPFHNAIDKINSFDQSLGYAIKKRAGEQAVLKYYPSGGSILRCGSIRGENYNTNEKWIGFYHYHFRLGNTLVLPNDETAVFQFIDVKDLARFGIKIMEGKNTGAYNMVGPMEPVRYKDYINLMHDASDNLSEIIWADKDWILKEKNIAPFNDLPNYIPLDSHGPGFYNISNDKAMEAGLKFSPIYTTIVETMSNISIDQLRELKSGNGMDDSRRMALIKEFKNQ